MRLLVTGIPGTGKTSIARKLAERYKLEYFNEKEAAIRYGIAEKKEGAYEIDTSKLKKALKKELKEKREYLVEGHLSCEFKLPIDKVFLLTCSEETLRKRLEERKYPETKILDNLFCLKQKYCQKRLEKHYKKEDIIIVDSSKTIKKAFNDIVSIIEGL